MINRVNQGYGSRIGNIQQNPSFGVVKYSFSKKPTGEEAARDVFCFRMKPTEEEVARDVFEFGLTGFIGQNLSRARYRLVKAKIKPREVSAETLASKVMGIMQPLISIFERRPDTLRLDLDRSDMGHLRVSTDHPNNLVISLLSGLDSELHPGADSKEQLADLKDFIARTRKKRIYKKPIPASQATAPI